MDTPAQLYASGGEYQSPSCSASAALAADLAADLAAALAAALALPPPFGVAGGESSAPSAPAAASRSNSESSDWRCNSLCWICRAMECLLPTLGDCAGPELSTGAAEVGLRFGKPPMCGEEPRDEAVVEASEYHDALGISADPVAGGLAAGCLGCGSAASMLVRLA